MPRRPSSQQTAAPLIPQSPTFDKLREAAAGSLVSSQATAHP